MEWEKLKVEIKKADKQINESKNKHSEFYKRQRTYWNGFKHGIGIAYKIYKLTKN